MNSLARLLLSIVLLTSTVVNAQNQQARAEKARQTAADQRIKAFGLTGEMLAKLRHKGVDVRNSLLARAHFDEKVRAVLSDCVVIGRVESIAAVPAPEKDPFHSKVRIIVASILKGENKDLKTVEVLLQSGPLSEKENEAIKVSTDPEFRTGEDVLLFMHYPQKNMYLAAAYKGYFQKHSANLHRDVFIVDKVSKFTVRDGRVMYHGEDKTIKSVIEGVREIESLLKN